MTNIAETLETALGAAQIVRTAKITGTHRVAPVFKEAAEDKVWAAKVAEFPGPALVVKEAARKTVETQRDPSRWTR